MYIVDLHSHSNVSDGNLNPDDLISYAAEKNVDMIALTDHDDISGLDLARKKAEELGISFINGVEISVTWRSRTIHMLGLNFDPNNQNLFKGLERIRLGIPTANDGFRDAFFCGFCCNNPVHAIAGNTARANHIGPNAPGAQFHGE